MGWFGSRRGDDGGAGDPIGIGMLVLVASSGEASGVAQEEAGVVIAVGPEARLRAGITPGRHWIVSFDPAVLLASGELADRLVVPAALLTPLPPDPLGVDVR